VIFPTVLSTVKEDDVRLRADELPVVITFEAPIDKPVTTLVEVEYVATLVSLIVKVRNEVTSTLETTLAPALKVACTVT